MSQLPTHQIQIRHYESICKVEYEWISEKASKPKAVVESDPRIEISFYEHQWSEVLNVFQEIISSWNMTDNFDDKLLDLILAFCQQKLMIFKPGIYWKGDEFRGIPFETIILEDNGNFVYYKRYGQLRNRIIFHKELIDFEDIDNTKWFLEGNELHLQGHFHADYVETDKPYYYRDSYGKREETQKISIHQLEKFEYKPIIDGFAKAKAGQIHCCILNLRIPELGYEKVQKMITEMPNNMNLAGKLIFIGMANDLSNQVYSSIY